MKTDNRYMGRMTSIICLCALLLTVLFAGSVTAGETSDPGDEAAGKYAHPDEVTNVLLIGSDTREPGAYGNSDAMIMLTINPAAEKIFLVSFMRDLYADIPGHGVQKINAAHAIGGGDLLMETIAENYHVRADYYIETEFAVMADLIDMIGGVTLELDENEVNVANAYIEVMCQEQGRNYEDEKIVGSGVLNLTGIQAVGYARNRKFGDDYERTLRQRKVLTQMLDKLKDMDAASLTQVATTILPKLHTDISLIDLIDLVLQIPAASGYTLVTDRIPYDGMFTTENEILIPDMEPTIDQLLSEIYEGY